MKDLLLTINLLIAWLVRLRCRYKLLVFSEYNNANSHIHHSKDIVIWDSHPLALGATPTQVFIDGIPQLDSPHIVPKSAHKQVTPLTPNYDQEAVDALEREGVPTLASNSTVSSRVVFTNVSGVWTRDNEGVVKMFHGEANCVEIEAGRITSMQKMTECEWRLAGSKDVLIDLAGGTIAPAITAAGTSIGLQDIAMESSTTDGVVPTLYGPASKLLDGALLRAVDGLAYETRDAM
jgi:hypothetical protein